MQMRSQLHKRRSRFIALALIVLLIGTTLLSIRFGAVNISLAEMVSAFQKWMVGNENMNLNERIFMDIRLPRAILCAIVGGCLATGGVLMQALFRNPIVEPGLVGTSSGAAFGAALYFVLGATFKFNAGEWTLPFAACGGAMLATFLAFNLSRSKQTGKSSVMALLLTGVAVNALFMSGVGFLAYIARDPQARSITFWNLGTLSGASWHSVTIVFTFTLLCFVMSLRYAKHLNALLIGEDEALFLGTNVKRVKLVVLSLNVIMVAVVTAFVGVIGFVGLIVPHLLRMLNGADNRFLIPYAAVMGAVLLNVSDLTARLVLQPAELPIGIVTSAIGVPVFIVLLRSRNYHF